MAPSSLKHGALSFAFGCMRAMQAAALISVIGLTSNFIGEIITQNGVDPGYLVGTSVLTCIAALYVAISYILYYDNQLPFLPAAIIDNLLLIALIVVACVVGKPISYLNCGAILGSETASTASFFAAVSSIRPDRESVWAAGGRDSCFKAKAVWGLAMALCVLFAFSTIVSLCLWRRLRTPASAKAAPRKDIEG